MIDFIKNKNATEDTLAEAHSTRCRNSPFRGLTGKQFFYNVTVAGLPTSLARRSQFLDESLPHGFETTERHAVNEHNLDAVLKKLDPKSCQY